MKKLFTILAIMLFALNINAQIPQKMTYQAVVRDASDKLIVNRTIGVKISILKGTTVVYSEVYNPNPSTNQNGLLTLEIGGGTPVLGDFNSINWADGPYFIKTEIDPHGGTSYSIKGQTQLLSVPYAFYAKTSGPVSENDPVFRASPAKNITDADITNWNNKLDSEVDGSVTNELQTLSINGNQLSISDGNTVTLPTGSGGDQWGSQVVEHDATLTGNGTVAKPLGVDVSAEEFDDWDKDASDDFSGSYNDLVNKPVTFFEVGGVNPPDNIKDNMYHLGNIGLGDDTTEADTKLNIYGKNKKAIYNDFEFTAEHNDFLIDNNLLMNASGAGPGTFCAGIRNTIDGTGSAPTYGILNRVINTGTGVHYGIKNYVRNSGYATIYGSNNVVSSNSRMLYGTYNSANTSRDEGEAYGTYNRLTNSSDGEQFGVYNSLEFSGDGKNYGTVNKITNYGNGTHYGVYDTLVNAGNGNQYAVYNIITNTGSGTHVGCYNKLTGTGSGRKYAVYALVDKNAGGTHYAVYGNAQKSGSYAGYFVGNVAISHKLISGQTGDADLKAYIYGRISSSGDIATNASSDGFTADRTGTGRYKITFNYSPGGEDRYVVVATALGSAAPRIVNVAISSTYFTIHVHNLDGDYVDSYCYFVVYKK